MIENAQKRCGAMTNRPTLGRAAGYIGLAMLIASWIGIGVPWRFLPPSSAPLRFLIALILAGPGAGVAGVVAGWLNSKLWYWLAVAGFTTAGFIVAVVAV